MNSPRLRIHLFGAPGCGKTHLARKLAKQLQIPVLHLDEIFISSGTSPHDVRTPAVERQAVLASFIRQESWIVEGVYSDWASDSFQSATHIVQLHAPLWLRQLRLLWRYGRINWRSGLFSRGKLGKLRRLMRCNRGFDRHDWPKCEDLLTRLGLAFHVCRSQAEACKVVGVRPETKKPAVMPA